MFYVVDDEICIVCSRVADIPTPKVPSVRLTCNLCRAPIWVTKKAPTDWPKVCLPCVKRAASAMRPSKSKRQSQHSPRYRSR